MATTVQLCEAISGQDNDKVSAWLEVMDLEVVNGTDGMGNTPLHLACRVKNQQALSELVNTHGVNVNVINKLDETPLHIAVMWKNQEALEKLINTTGVIVNSVDEFKPTPLHHAIKYQNQEAIEKLLSIPEVNVNACDEMKATPLHLAVKYHNHEAVEKLINTSGVNVNAIDMWKQTPMHIATLYGNHRAVEKLLQVPGINVNLRDDDGRTPFMIVASKNEERRRKKKDEKVAIQSDSQEGGWEPEKIRANVITIQSDSQEGECDPEEIRANVINQYCEKIVKVNEKIEDIKQALSRKAEMKVEETKDLKTKQDLEKVNLDRKSNQERIQLEQVMACIRHKMAKREEKFKKDGQEMLKRHTAEKIDLEEKYSGEESQQALANLMKASDQLGEDLKKLDMDPNELTKLEKARAILECPICMEIMRPPTRIWMCQGSHTICEPCRGFLINGGLCPKKINIRALVMEDIAKALFNQ